MPDNNISSKPIERWNNLGIRDKIQEGAAITLLVSGIIIAFLSFFLNHYQIETGVLFYISECFLFAGAFMGFNIYFRSKMIEFNTNAENKIKQLDSEAERCLGK